MGNKKKNLFNNLILSMKYFVVALLVLGIHTSFSGHAKEAFAHAYDLSKPALQTYGKCMAKYAGHEAFNHLPSSAQAVLKFMGFSGRRLNWFTDKFNSVKSYAKNKLGGAACSAATTACHKASGIASTRIATYVKSRIGGKVNIDGAKQCTDTLLNELCTVMGNNCARRRLGI